MLCQSSLEPTRRLQGLRLCEKEWIGPVFPEATWPGTGAAVALIPSRGTGRSNGDGTDRPARAERLARPLEVNGFGEQEDANGSKGHG